MALDTTAPRSRRSLLTAAAGGAAALAASAAAPLGVAAAATNMQTETANASAAETSLNDSADRTVGFKTTNVGVAPAIVVHNAAGAITNAGDTDPTDPGGISTSAGVYATSVDATNAVPYWAATFTGVYGFAPSWSATVPGFAQGVWGDSPDVGVLGSGDVGVRGEGFLGMVAAGGFGSGATGLRAWGGDGTGDDIALDVRGKVKFSRSGRTTIGAGRSSVKVNLKGTTSSSRVFAVLHSNRASRYVRAVVPTTGSFTIHLNTSVTSATYVAWFVIN